MESTSSPEQRDHDDSHVDVSDRLSALERRVAELEADATSAPKAEDASAVADHALDGGTTGAGLPGDADTFWALHGLVDHLGDGVTYTGHTTPPGSEGPVSWQVGMSSEGLAQIDFAEAAGPLAALGHPVRLQLLQSIYEGTTTVAELGKDERFGTTGQIYHHVHALASAGWLENARRGHWRVPAQRIIPLLTLVLIGTH
ncbi:ArsR/SmtB family transcription factor [Brevibacterium atlanticum]|uniref:ArsR/SmtB family transcription factor n=1 Tax=Brevibacterium atlanticum TaxID=2697563 RepID=UPI00141EA6B4|nr:ArsR family transcriptional regulator [Brevibacterium atlanticum]